MALTKVSGDFIQDGSITQGHLHSSHGITTSDIGEGSNLYFTTARVDSRIGDLSTSDLSEGTNLYYTDARTDARIALQVGSNLDLSSKSTSDLSEGTNLYYTQARFNTAFAAKSTSDLSEGTNLYYTDARADARIAAASTSDLSEGTNLYYTDARVGSYLTTNNYLTASSTHTLTNKSGNISQWTNDSGYITDGNTNWDNSYGFITASSTETLTNKSGNISMFTNDSGYITDGNTNWNNSYGFITASSTDTLTNKSGNISQWTNDSGYITGYTETDTLATVTGRGASTSTAVTFAKATFNTSSTGLPRQITIKEDGDTENSMGSYPGAWTSALNIQSNDASTYLWLSPLTSNIPRIQTNYGQLDFYTGNNTNRALHLSGTSARSEIFYDLGDTNTYFNSSEIVLRHSSPQIALRDTDHRSVVLHNNSNRFYVLGAPADSTSYAQINGVWPWYVQLDTNDVYTGNIGYAGNSYRAPVFYDSNNTTYYTNPAGESVIDRLNRAEHHRGHFEGSYNNIGGNSTYTNPIYTIGSSYNPNSTTLGNMYGIGFAHPNLWGSGKTSDWGMYVAANGSFEATIGQGSTTIWAKQNIVSDGNVYGNAFYDQGDTSYYVNPNSTSNTYAMKAYQYQGNGNVGGTGSASWHPSGIYSAGHNWLYGGINGGGNSATNFSDVRATIFYEYSNTAYYLDAGGTSNLVSTFADAFLGRVTTSGDGQSNYPFRLASDYNAYMMTVASNTWGLFWAGNSGARYGTNGNGGPGNIWSNSTNPNEFAFVGSDSTAWTVHGSSGNVWLKGYGTAAGSYRAPIFYDSDNTGYYTNPASTSNIYRIQAQQFIASDWLRTTGNSGWYSNTHGGGMWMEDSVYVRVYGDKRFYNPNTTYLSIYTAGGVTSLDQMRSPIYYDYNNTTYYTRPSTSSYINSLHTAGNIQAGASGTGNIYIGGTSGNYFRFHTNNSHTYFDANVGDIHWRQGASTRFIFYMTSANMTINGSLTQNSDERVKENIVEIPNAIDKVKAMKGVYYNRTDFNTDVTKVGVLAQEVEAVLPELIVEASDSGLKSVAYGELTAVLINAVKEQQTIIDDLKSRLETLENN